MSSTVNTQLLPNGIYQAPSTSGGDSTDDVTGQPGSQEAGKVDGTKFVVGAANPEQQFTTAGTPSTTSTPDSEGVPLPDVQGPGMSGGQAASQTVGWLQMGSKPMSLSQAVSLLSNVESDQMIQYGRMKNLYGNNETSMQKASAQQTIKQVQGERESALFKLAGSVVASGLSFGLGLRGGQLQMAGTKEVPLGNAMTALGQTVGQLVNNTTDAIDKLGGGQYQADQAKIQKSIIDIYVSMFKTQQDNFNNGYEDKRKNLQSVFDMMRQVADANNQTIMNVANNV